MNEPSTRRFCREHYDAPWIPLRDPLVVECAHDIPLYECPDCAPVESAPPPER